MHQNEDQEVAFESHLSAIEDTVEVADLDGGCNHKKQVLYHANKIREIFSEMIKGER